MSVNTGNGDWAFVSGMVAAREGRMLPAPFFQQMLAEAGTDGILARLGETVLRDRVREADDLRHLDEHAAECWMDSLNESRAVCPSPAIADLLELARHFVSFKNFVKRAELGLDVRDALPPRYSEETWQRLWAGLETDLPGAFREAAVRARSTLQVAPDRPDVLDAAVDGVALSALCQQAQQCSPFVAEHMGRRDTARGVELLWRARAMGLPDAVVHFILSGRHEQALFKALLQAEEQDWPDILEQGMRGLPAAPLSAAKGLEGARAFARAADEWLMAHARTGKHVAFGPERVFGYLVGLEAELYNLKVTAGGRALGISAETLAGRLRACYV